MDVDFAEFFTAHFSHILRKDGDLGIFVEIFDISVETGSMWCSRLRASLQKRDLPFGTEVGAPVRKCDGEAAKLH